MIGWKNFVSETEHNHNFKCFSNLSAVQSNKKAVQSKFFLSSNFIFSSDQAEISVLEKQIKRLTDRIDEKNNTNGQTRWLNVLFPRKGKTPNFVHFFTKSKKNNGFSVRPPISIRQLQNFFLKNQRKNFQNFLKKYKNFDFKAISLNFFAAKVSTFKFQKYRYESSDFQNIDSQNEHLKNIFFENKMLSICIQFFFEKSHHFYFSKNFLFVENFLQINRKNVCFLQNWHNSVENWTNSSENLKINYWFLRFFILWNLFRKVDHGSQKFFLQNFQHIFSSLFFSIFFFSKKIVFTLFSFQFIHLYRKRKFLRNLFSQYELDIKNICSQILKQWISKISLEKIRSNKKTFNLSREFFKDFQKIITRILFFQFSKQNFEYFVQNVLKKKDFKNLFQNVNKFFFFHVQITMFPKKKYMCNSNWLQSLVKPFLWNFKNLSAPEGFQQKIAGFQQKIAKNWNPTNQCYSSNRTVHLRNILDRTQIFHFSYFNSGNVLLQFPSICSVKKSGNLQFHKGKRNSQNVHFLFSVNSMQNWYEKIFFHVEKIAIFKKNQEIALFHNFFMCVCYVSFFDVFVFPKNYCTTLFESLILQLFIIFFSLFFKDSFLFFHSENFFECSRKFFENSLFFNNSVVFPRVQKNHILPNKSFPFLFSAYGVNQQKIFQSSENKPYFTFLEKLFSIFSKKGKPYTFKNALLIFKFQSFFEQVGLQKMKKKMLKTAQISKNFVSEFRKPTSGNNQKTFRKSEQYQKMENRPYIQNSNMFQFQKIWWVLPKNCIRFSIHLENRTLSTVSAFSTIQLLLRFLRFFNFFPLKKKTGIQNFSGKTQNVPSFPNFQHFSGKALKFYDFMVFLCVKYEKNLKQIFFFKINPTRQSVCLHLKACQKILKHSIGQTQLEFMKKLQKEIYFWCIHLNSSSAKKIMDYCDHRIFLYLWNWAKKTHPNKSHYWIRQKYFHLTSKKEWFFGKKMGNQFICLYVHSQIFKNSEFQKIRYSNSFFNSYSRI